MTAEVWRPAAPGWPTTETVTEPSAPAEPDTSKCGTYAGLQAHNRRGGTPCGPCIEAGRVYVTEWRRRNPDKVANAVQKQHARDRALRKLAKRFPREFESIYMAELNQMSDGGAA